MGIEPATLLKPEEISRIVKTVGIDRFMIELIENLESSFANYDEAVTQIPVRDGFSYTSPVIGLLEWMPILQSGDEMLMKLVGYHPGNPDARALPTILSTFSLFDATHGGLKAILDGTLVTALRTGAASAMASRFLAMPGSSDVGLVGCGAQSITQLHALCQIFEFKSIRYFDTDSSAMDSFKHRCSPFRCQAEFLPSTLAECVSDVDILCVATSVDVNAGPVFEDMTVREHLHINAVGSDFPGKVEIPLPLLQRSYVTPDSYDQAIKEGECQRLNPQQIGLPFTELLAQGKELGLKSKTTVFDSTGWALEDLVVTRLVLKYAEELGVGTEMDLVDASGDPRNPYETFRGSHDVGVEMRVSCR